VGAVAPPPLPPHAPPLPPLPQPPPLAPPTALPPGICPKCRRQNPPQARFCGSCGQTLTPGVASAPAVAAPPPLPGAPAAPARPMMAAAPGAAGVVITGPMEYAGFWLRFAAVLVDGLILMCCFVVFWVIMLLASFVVGLIAGAVPILGMICGLILFAVYLAVAIAAPWYYFAKQESSPQMSTIGKRVLGLQVVDLQGQRISFMKATGRHFGKILSSFLYIGFIMAAFTEKKQGLHDILAGCLVIKKRS
jgi:uncharacterized RDD family membrane protein YckC